MDSQPEDSDIPLPSTSTATFDTQHPGFRIDDAAVSRIDEAIRAFLGLSDLEVSYRFTTLAEIQCLNDSFRAKNQPTDVLAFPQLEWREPYTPSNGTSWRDNIEKAEFSPAANHLGDVVICLERAAEQAEELGHSLGREVVFLMIHGTLHLCGHDHHDPAEEQAMLALQRRVLTHLLELGMQPLWQQSFCPKDAD